MTFWEKGKPDGDNNSSLNRMIKYFYPNWAAKAFQKNTTGGGK
jgi:hypothetical protein